jgi:hypothetical protein
MSQGRAVGIVMTLGWTNESKFKFQKGLLQVLQTDSGALLSLLSIG